MATHTGPPACFDDQALRWVVSIPVVNCAPIERLPQGKAYLTTSGVVGNVKVGGEPWGISDRYRLPMPWSNVVETAGKMRSEIAQWHHELPHRVGHDGRMREETYGTCVHRRTVDDVTNIFDTAFSYARTLSALNIQMDAANVKYTAVVPGMVFWRCSQYGQIHPINLAKSTGGDSVSPKKKIEGLIITAPTLLDEERMAWFMTLELAVHILLSAIAHAPVLSTPKATRLLNVAVRAAEIASFALGVDRLWKNMATTKQTHYLSEYHRDTTAIYWSIVKGAYSILYFSIGGTHRTVPLSASCTAHEFFVTGSRMSRMPSGTGPLQWTPLGRIVECLSYCTATRICYTAAEICFIMATRLRIVDNEFHAGYNMLRYACLCLAGATLCLGKSATVVAPVYLPSIKEYLKLAPSAEALTKTWQKYVRFYDERFSSQEPSDAGADTSDAIPRTALLPDVLMHFACQGLVVAESVASVHLRSTLVDLETYSGNVYEQHSL